MSTYLDHFRRWRDAPDDDTRHHVARALFLNHDTTELFPQFTSVDELAAMPSPFSKPFGECGPAQFQAFLDYCEALMATGFEYRAAVKRQSRIGHARI